MFLQWYPGHMTKAMRMMEDNIKLVESVLYVLDSRAVAASFNYNFDKLLNNKTVLYVLNKADMVDRTMLNKWMQKLQSEGKRVICTNSANGNCSKVVEELLELNRETLARYAGRGAKKAIRAMVIGIPNCGKSTLVNALCGAKRATVGDKAGVTRGKQWVSLGKGVDLLDTPGTLSPSFENQTIAKHLAFLGSINEDIVDSNELAVELLKFLIENYGEVLKERYKLASLEGSIPEIMEECAKNRGFILRGGVLDTERMANAMIDDFRKGRMGRIMLERADDKY